ncbi:MAG: GAF domain-containing protein [Chloroflexi bacterium]|nr:GAF domain-containing protein [Chloroflexota bacterium]
MSAFNSITLLLNGGAFALALGFLVIVLWNDHRKALNQFFAIFLLMVTLWNGGLLLAQMFALVDELSAFIALPVAVVELAYAASSVAIYALTAVLIRIRFWRFRLFAFTALATVIAYRVFLILIGVPPSFEVTPAGAFIYQTPLILGLFFLVFDGATLYLLWRDRRKIRSRSLALGIALFVIGQGIGFLNPDLQVFAITIYVNTIAALMISFGVVRQEFLDPLAERDSQVEAIRRLSLAITNQTAQDSLLHQIAYQTAALLNADGVGIFLTQNQQHHEAQRDLNGATQAGELELVTVHNLPKPYLGTRITPGDGIVGTVAHKRQSLYVENYARDWHGAVDLPLANETFGAVIGSPLIYGREMIGVLMVVAAQHGPSFGRDDVYLLELLAAQAVVAIIHTRLFEEQQALTREVEFSRSQLETVLMSTESPVIAIDRRFRLIFANPAAKGVFSILSEVEQTPIADLLPANAFPPNLRAALRVLKQNRSYIYEVALDGKYFLCHLACLGWPRITGWVAVLNDVSQLKELDRVKSEMIRMTSHDLKNPLQAAMAHLELLRDDVFDLADAESQTSMDVIEKQLQRMFRIISGILDLERLKSGTLALQPTDPTQVVTAAVEDMRQMALESQVLLQTDMSGSLPEFHCDIEQFERALSNLIENAIKFTAIKFKERGGRVCIGVRWQDSDLLFTIEDNGVGIAPELQPQIFERFSRARRRSTEHISGSGLGLSLVKTVVENHHGQVWLTSEEGVGSTFYLQIPLNPRG